MIRTHRITRGATLSVTKTFSIKSKPFVEDQDEALSVLLNEVALYVKKHKPVIISMQVQKGQNYCSKCGVWEVEWTVILTTSAPQPEKPIYDEDTGSYYVMVTE
jgi:hypothetical protein